MEDRLSAMLVIALLFIGSVNAQLKVSPSCKSEEDKTAVGRCLRPWLNMWENMRAQEAVDSELHFPVLYYSREGVLALCEKYLDIQDTCLTAQVQRTCANDIMIRFVKSHMSYFCGNDATKALGRWDCISQAVKAKPQCRDLIRGTPQPGRQGRKCLGIPKFYRCLEDAVAARCGAEGNQIIEDAIDAFGCSLNSAENIIPPATTSEEEEAEKIIVQFDKKHRSGEEVIQVQQSRPVSTGKGLQFTTGSNENSEPINKQFEIVDDPRNGRIDPWKNRQAGPGLTFGEAHQGEVKNNSRRGVGAQPPKSNEKHAGGLFEVVDDPRHDRINPWRGRSEGPGLVFGQSPSHSGGLVLGGQRSNSELPRSNEKKHSQAFNSEGRFQLDPFTRRPPEPTTRGRGLIFFNPDAEFPALANPLGNSNFEADRSILEGAQIVVLGRDVQPTFAPRPISFVTRRPGSIPVSTTPWWDTTTSAFQHSTTTFSTIAPATVLSTTTRAQPLTTTTIATTTEPSTAAPIEIEDVNAVTGSEIIKEIQEPQPAIVEPVPTTCDVESQNKIVQCFGPLSESWEEIHEAQPALRKNYFPLYNYTSDELNRLCDVLTTTLTSCVSPAVLGICQEMEVVQFINAQLGYACAPPARQDFFLSFECIHMQQSRKIGCLNLLEGDNLPNKKVWEKCDKMPNYISCLREEVGKSCGEDALRIWLESIQNFGCTKGLGDIPTAPPTEPPTTTNAPITVKREVPQTQPTVTTTETTTSAVSTTTEDEETSTAETEQESAEESTSKIISVEESVRSAEVHATESVEPVNGTTKVICTPNLRQQARQCLLPLMLKWSAMNENLAAVSFPSFHYTKTQWLELCDGYANAFLCGGFEPFQQCIDDAFVLFANTYLGYTCSPQNVQKFMQQAECMNNVTKTLAPVCQRYIKGTVSPTQPPSQRCNGLSDYHVCVNEHLTSDCGAEAIRQFEQVVEQIGCQL